MNDFYPFIYEKKKKSIEQLPLYIELINPPPEYNESEEDSEKEEDVIIIEFI